jgi:hypothetical protein
MSKENKTLINIIPCPQVSYVNNTQFNKKYKKERHNLEEFSKNKFDSKFYGRFNFGSSRKCSKDSSNLSTSNEDIFENDFIDKNALSPIETNSNNNYKGKALDFKIKYKTELCKFYEINGHCRFGDNCAYAHGIENLRSKVTNSTAYRTRKCNQFYEKGYCPYGSRCQFQHQLKSNIINNPYDRKMTYKKILETISKLENVDNIKKLIEKPRLEVFKEIIDNKNIEQCESKLLEDIKCLKNENFF